MDKVITRIIDLPLGVNGITVLDENGDYNIYLNAALTDSGRRKTYAHEVSHIIKNHFYIKKTAKQC